MTLAEIYSETQSRLGFSATSGLGVDVELNDTDLLVCLKRTLRVLNRNRPRRNRAVLPGASSAVRQYLISSHPGFYAITDVHFLSESNAVDKGPLDPFDPLLNGVLAYNYGQDGAAGYARYVSAYQDAQIVFGNEPSWHAERDSQNNYYLYLSLPITPIYQVGYEYLWHITPDENQFTGVQRILKADEDWCMDYMEACAKIIVGRRRGKFGGVPDGSDGNSEIDSTVLLDEGMNGQQGIVELENQIKLRRRPHLPIIG